MTQTLNKKNYLANPFTIAMLTASAFVMNIAATQAAEFPSDWQERIKMGVHAYDEADPHWAFDRNSKLMMDGERKFGSSDGRMARLYTNMGEVYAQEQKYEYAQQCLKKGLELAEKAYGNNSLEVVPALIDLAQMHVHQGNYAKAQPLFKRALAIVDKPDDDKLLPYVAVIETDLGSMFFANGNFAFAEVHLKRALSVATESLGPNHKWTTIIGGMYAASLNQQGKTKEAKAIERAAVAKANEIQSSIFIWNKQIGRADEAMAKKQFPDAEAALKLALKAAQELPEEPMLQVVTLNRYGQLFVLKEQPALAIREWKKAQALADSVLGLEDKSVLAHAQQLADLEKTLQQFADAEPLYLRILANAKKQFGPESAEYAKALVDLANNYAGLGNHSKAVTYYSKALALMEKQFGNESEKLIPILVAQSKVGQADTTYWQITQKPEETPEACLKRAADIATKKFGKDSKEIVPILEALSFFYERQLYWEKAAKTCTQIIAADEKNFGPESAETAKALEQYAGVLQVLGLKKEAELIEARVAKIKGPKNDD